MNIETAEKVVQLLKEKEELQMALSDIDRVIDIEVITSIHNPLLAYLPEYVKHITRKEICERMKVRVEEIEKEIQSL